MESITKTLYSFCSLLHEHTTFNFITVNNPKYIICVIAIFLFLLQQMLRKVFVMFCVFVRVILSRPLNWTCLHYLQHSFFEYLFNLYYLVVYIIGLERNYCLDVNVLKICGVPQLA